MALFVVAYLAGVLTIVSPCILPVLPFVFARADRSFLRSGLPLLVGMALTFTVVASLAVAGGWAVTANRYGRYAAIALLVVFGLALLIPPVGDRLARPVVRLGERLSRSGQASGANEPGVGPSVVLGMAIGLLWAPCAGPVLGLILTGAALQGTSTRTTLLLLAYAAGAATSLALALLVGGRVLSAMKRSLGLGVRIRQALGAAVLVAVVAIALGLDTGALTNVSTASTTRIEQGLVDRFHADPQAGGAPAKSDAASTLAGGSTPGGAMTGDLSALPVEGQLPSLDGAVSWLNSKPLSAADLRGKVVLVDFWTYSCINCLRAIPYVEAWAEKYRADGLVVIGVHSPEFAFEQDLGNVRKAVGDLHISYPVATDNHYAIWRAFNNSYWPAEYFIDAQGRIRGHHFGEGDYPNSEAIIQTLLAEAGNTDPQSDPVTLDPAGTSAPSDVVDEQTPETYVGYGRAQSLVSPGGAVQNVTHTYTAGTPRLNQWGLFGTWTVGEEDATLDAAGGGIVFDFHARDLHLVLGPGADGRPVRYRITLDGKPPGTNAGVDVAADGTGVVTGQRLYQLVRQQGAIEDRTFKIEFLDGHVDAYAFTFG